jgi:protease-4
MLSLTNRLRIPLLALCLVATVSAQEPEEVVEVTSEVAQIPLFKPAGRYMDLPEAAFDPTALLGGGGAQPKAFFKLIETIDELAAGEGEMVLMDLTDPVGLNLAQMREVERAFGRLHAAGKKVVAYVENCRTVTVQLMAMCDRVLMADMGMVDFSSPAITVMHMKDALDLLGVNVDVTRVGEFKGAVEPYMLPEMSDRLREHYVQMLDSMNADIVRRVAEGRGITQEKVRDLQRRRMLRASEALEAGLVDALVPWRGAEHALAMQMEDEEFELVDAPKKKKKKRNLDFFSLMRDLMNPKDDEEEIEDPEIVVLHLSGAISDGDRAVPGSIVSGPVVEQVEKLRDNENVKAVVVRINSPGGSATASEAIRLALAELAEAKPVVYSMGDLAASGGYWITAIGRPIFAEVGTITGSIGVFSLRMSPGPLMRRIGVNNDMVALDPGAEMDRVDRPWSTEGRATMQGFVDEIYDRFIAIVATSRSMAPDAVRPIAGGRVWSGAQALDLDLVDQLGGIDDAVALVRSEVGGDEDIEVRHYPQPRDLASSFLSQMLNAKALLESEPRMGMLLQQAGSCDVLFALLRDALDPGAAQRVYALLPGDLTIR